MGRSLQNLSFTLSGTGVSKVRYHGVEVLRELAYLVRDPNWATMELVQLDAAADTAKRAEGAWQRRFRSGNGALEGTFRLEAEETGDTATLRADLTLVARRDVSINRAGFVLLHPIAGVAGRPLRVGHSDGTEEQACFPALVSPGQVAFDIARLMHCVGGIEIDIALEGDAFEMEDQRNWTDASFKTYSRPLALPRPYSLAAGASAEQSVIVRLRRRGEVTMAAEASDDPASVVAPEIALAYDRALHPDVSFATFRHLHVAELLVRVDRNGDWEAQLPVDVELPVALEIVLDETGCEDDLDRLVRACAARGLRPARVMALTRPYLSSHQPDGPWPQGPRPFDLVPLLRRRFPDAQIGGGMLTNFTEFNRCPPVRAAIDYATFGTTAIVHAADDASVLETLEALAHVLASARVLAGDRPLRLGLVTIGMRSNPYGSGVAANPHLHRIPMARIDPRHGGSFAAAWAVAAVAAAARGGVASLAPAMVAGPLGLGAEGAPSPLHHAVAALAALGGRNVAVRGGPSSGLVWMIGRGRRGVAGIVANLGPESTAVSPPAIGQSLLHLSASSPQVSTDRRWIDGAGVRAGIRLAPLEIAIVKETTD